MFPILFFFLFVVFSYCSINLRPQTNLKEESTYNGELQYFKRIFDPRVMLDSSNGETNDAYFKNINLPEGFTMGLNGYYRAGRTGEGNSVGRGVAVKGNYALVVGYEGSSKLAIFDVKDPGNITLMSERDVSYAESIRIFGNYAFVGSQGLKVYDITNLPTIVEVKESAVIINHSTRLVNGMTISKDGKYVLLAGTTKGLIIIDISDPLKAFKIAEITTNIDNCIGVDISKDNNEAYVVTNSAFKIFDISDKSNAQLIGELTDNINPVDVSVNGNFAYVGDVDAVLIVNITNRSQPKLLKKYLTSYAHEMKIKDQFLFLADLEGGLKIYDISDPSELLQVENFQTSGRADSIGLYGAYVFVGIFNNGYILDVYDISKREIEGYYLDAGTYSIDFFACNNEEECIDFSFIIDNQCSEGLYGKTCNETCPEGYFGQSCENWYCSSINRSNSSVCSSQGICSTPNSCTCNEGFYGDECEFWQCFGIPFNDDDACSDNGVCTFKDECDCKIEFFGSDCQYSTSTVLLVVFVTGSTTLVIIFCAIFIPIAFIFIKKFKKFSKLKNIDIHLAEQEMEKQEMNSLGNTPKKAAVNVDKNRFLINIGEIKIGKKIGSGGSNSSVFLAEYNNTEVAFKCFTTNLYQDNYYFKEFEKEVSIFGGIAFPYILHYYGAIVDPPRVGIVMEYAKNGDLENFLSTKENQNFPIFKKLTFIHQIAKAMQYLKSKGIIHRDLKPKNVLVTASLETRLMDFGLSRSSDNEKTKTKRIGSSKYMAPEVVLGSDYSFEIDVFAFAILSFEVLSQNFTPYGKEKSTFNIELSISKDPSLRPKINKEDEWLKGNLWIKEIIEKCWSHDPKERMTFQEIIDLFNEKLKEIKK